MPKKTNLLYVITKLELGGAQKQLLSLIRSLDKERYNIFLFTAKDGLLIEEALAIKDVVIKRSKFLERPISPVKDLLALIEIFVFIRNNKIDILHTHSSKAGILGRLAAKSAKVKIIIHTVHGWPFNDFQAALLKKIFIRLEKLAAGFSNKIIAVSVHDRQVGLANRIGVSEKYAIVRYGINYSEFSVSNDGLKAQLNMKPDDMLVGMIACFKPQKSPQDFVKLAYLVTKITPNIKFLLVGDGVLRKEIEHLISSHNIRQNFVLTGWRKDIPHILSAMDVFVLTSLWEGLPITVLEAMAAAKPVVVTDTGGVKEVVIEGETGFLVKPHDAEKMSERLIILLNNKDLRQQIGKNAKGCLSSCYTIENMASQTSSLYESLLYAKEAAYVN